MGREIERKYLVKTNGWRESAGTGTPYLQGYLSLDPERSVRVRTAGGRGFLTVKGKSQGAGRDEFEYSIPVEDARDMLHHLCIPPLIEKTRYVIQADRLEWEIDEFAGANVGLVVAEIELENDTQDVVKPEWLGQEVTSDPRYYNLNLVRTPYSRWREERSG